MKDRLIPAVYELRDEIIIRADAETIQKALKALKRIEVTDNSYHKITEPYFMRLLMINTENGETVVDHSQWLNRPEIIDKIAENTGAEIVTGSGRSFRELAEDKNREVEEYRAILRAHKEAIDHITAFDFSDYHNLTNEIINTQSMLTLAIRLTQIEEDLSDIASVLHRMADKANETNEQHTKKER